MKRFYITIVCQILSLILFLSGHFIQTIYYLGDYHYLFGIMVGNLIVDICIFIAIGFQILSILLLISIEVSHGK